MNGNLHKIIWMSCIIGILASCSSADEPTSAVSSSAEVPDTFVTLQEALEKAQPYFEALDGSSSRSVLRTVEKVEFLNGNSSTRSDVPTYYIVNFDSDQGFAILSADERLLPVFAFSDQGTLSLSDTLYNKGLAKFISTLPQPSDSPSRVIGGPITNPTTYTKVVSPLLSQAVRLWSQRSPYNSYCPIDQSTNEQSLVGCGPLAVGMIMSFYEYPTSYNGYSLNWAQIKLDSNNSNLFKFLVDLGNPNNLDAEYGSSGTSVSTGNIDRTFYNMGYKSLSSSYFNETTAQSALQAHTPLLLVGQATEGGHAWSIDGLYKVTTTQLSSTIGGTDTIVNTFYYHCVWGWGGKGNGYFAYSNGFGRNASYYEDSESQYTTYFFSGLSMKYNFKTN